MTSKQSNKITNLVGIIFYCLSIFEYFTDRDMYFIACFVLIGTIGVAFNNAMIKELINKIINKKVS